MGRWDGTRTLLFLLLNRERELLQHGLHMHDAVPTQRSWTHDAPPPPPPSPAAGTGCCIILGRVGMLSIPWILVLQFSFILFFSLLAY